MLGKKKGEKKDQKTAEALPAGDRMRLNISIRRTADDHVINPAFGLSAAGGATQLLVHSTEEKRAPQPSQPFARGRTCIIFLSFHFI